MASDFTIADVLAWARTKPADETYCYIDNGHCAIAQFLRDTGRAVAPTVNAFSWAPTLHGKRVALPAVLNLAVQQCWGNGYSFGALVRRLEVLEASPDILALGETGDLEFHSAFLDAIQNRNPPEPPKSCWTRPEAYLTDIEQVEA